MIFEIKASAEIEAKDIREALSKIGEFLCDVASKKKLPRPTLLSYGSIYIRNENMKEALYISKTEVALDTPLERG